MRDAMLRLSTFLVLFCCYSVMCGLFVFSETMGTLLSRWGQSSEMDVYLDSEAKETEIAEIRNILKAFDQQVDYELVGKDKALASFKKQLPEALRGVSQDADLMGMIPSYFSIITKRGAFNGAPFLFFESLSKRLRTFTFVEDVSYGKDWVKKYQKIVVVIRGISGYIWSALGLALVLVVGNSIRAVIYSKIEEIEILELVGATSWLIRKPFYIEGILVSGFGMALALLAVNGLVLFCKSSSSQVFELWGFVEALGVFSPLQTLTFLVGAALMGWAATWLCLFSINDGWAASRR